MYSVKAEDFHRPKVLINESFSPALAAAVAAPILKLWPLKAESSTPMEPRTSCRCRTSLGRESGVPSLCMNRGPGRHGRQARYASNADTGQRLAPVAPR